MIRDARLPATAYLLIAGLGTLAFAPTVTGHLIADDWMMLARNMDVRLAEVPSWLVQVRHDWYRPVHEIVAAGSWRLFGTNPLGYRLLTLVLYGIVVALVGIAAERLARDRRVGIVAAATFASMHFHAEPATWFAAGNELLAAAFALSMFIAYLRYRHTASARFLVVSFVCYMLALGSKESAVALPLVLAVYEVVDRERAGQFARRLLAVAPFLVAGALFLLLRLSAGNPYPHSLTPALMLKNAAHYATLELLAWPIDFDYTSYDPAQGITHWLPPITILMACLSWLLLGAAWLAARPWRSVQGQLRSLIVAVSWGLVTIAPVLPIVSERTAFLSSVAVAWVVALLVVGTWVAANERRWVRAAVVVGLVMFMAANAISLMYRAHWWGMAGAMSRDTMAQLEAQFVLVPPDQPVVLIGLPDHVRHAYVFRNAFPHAGRVLGHQAPVLAVLDTVADEAGHNTADAPHATPVAATDDEPTAPSGVDVDAADPHGPPLVLYYEGGRLVSR